MTCMLLSMQYICVANTIHWITIVDTTDPNVGTLDVTGREFLYGAFVDKVNAALRESGYQSQIHDCYGASTSPEACKNIVNNLQCSPNDVIVFYYIGHGGRAIGDSDPFPQMCLAQSSESRYIPLSWVHSTLKSKNPRLLITIGMCCNSYSDNITIKNAPNFSVNNGIAYYSNAEMESIRKLFLENKGDIIMSSSRPGQTSVGGYIPNFNVAMDIFTFCYVADFNLYVTQETNPSWNVLLNGVATDVQNVAYTCFMGHQQSPQSRINVTSASRPSKETCKRDQQSVKNEVEQNQSTSKTDQKQTQQNRVSRQGRLCQSLTHYLDAIIDTDNTLPTRVDYAKAISELFTPDAEVRVLAETSNIVVDKMTVSDFLMLASTSKNYHKIIVTSVDVITIGSEKKISGIKIKEYIVK